MVIVITTVAVPVSDLTSKLSVDTPTGNFVGSITSANVAGPVPDSGVTISLLEEVTM